MPTVSGVGTSWKVGRLNSERLPSPPFPCREAAPSTQLGGLGSAVSSPSGVWGEAPENFEFGAY